MSKEKAQIIKQNLFKKGVIKSVNLEGDSFRSDEVMRALTAFETLVLELQTERDLKIQNQNEWLESYRKKLESSERENKELKYLLEKSQYNANGLFSEKETLISQLIDAHSQLSSLKEQADKLEGALDNLTSKVNHILNTSNITEQQDRFNHLIDAYNRSFEVLSNYKQSKGE